MKMSFIGAGQMAEAMMASLLRARIAAASEIFASDVDAERRNEVKRLHGVNTYASNRLVAGMAPILFLAVKPQNLDEVMQELAPTVSRNHLVFSIVAGKRIAQIEAALPQARVIRVMPNVACLASEAMSVFALGARATEPDRFVARKLLASFGKVVELPESRFDAVTALSGSGPAFLAWALDQMVTAASEQGLDRKDAMLLGIQTMLGTAKLLMEKHIEPKDLIMMVASPRGTAAAGLKVLEASAAGPALRATVQAAVARSRELSGAG